MSIVEPASIADTRFALTDGDYTAIRRMLHEHAGINLGASKRDLVQGRLARRLRALGCADFSDYVAVVSAPDAEVERRLMINALTTNLTGFFREAHHFDFLGDELLPRLIAERHGSARRLRIWSAGCSSGEEPYSIAMTLLAKVPELARWDARILATDIDTDMVATGSAGLYDAERAERVPPALRQRYLQPGDSPGKVAVSDALRALVAFRPLNLLGPWPMRGPFDAIFCRNVVIYFDKPTQRTLFDRMAEILVPGGHLLIGHSESLFHVCERFDHLGRTIYRKAA